MSEAVGAGAPLVELRGVGRAIPGGGFALRDATARIARGEYVAVVGPSGSGKTTLLSILGLLDTPTTGTYLFDGVDVGSLDEVSRNQLRGERIGFVFQNAYLMADDSVADNVGLPLRVRGMSARRRRRLVNAALVQVGLSGFQNARAGELSGGEKQRVAVARALVGAPDVILADEPTGALDADSTRRLVALLQQINRAGTTVIVVTHDPIVAAGATRQLVIVDGVLSGAPHGDQAAAPQTPARDIPDPNPTNPVTIGPSEPPQNDSVPTTPATPTPTPQPTTPPKRDIPAPNTTNPAITGPSEPPQNDSVPTTPSATPTPAAPPVPTAPSTPAPERDISAPVVIDWPVPPALRMTGGRSVPPTASPDATPTAAPAPATTALHDIPRDIPAPDTSGWPVPPALTPKRSRHVPAGPTPRTPARPAPHHRTPVPSLDVAALDARLARLGLAVAPPTPPQTPEPVPAPPEPATAQPPEPTPDPPSQPLQPEPEPTPAAPDDDTVGLDQLFHDAELMLDDEPVAPEPTPVAPPQRTTRHRDAAPAPPHAPSTPKRRPGPDVRRPTVARSHSTAAPVRTTAIAPAAAVPLAAHPDGTSPVRWGQELADAALAPLSRPIRWALVLLAYLLGVAALVGAVGLAQSATGQIVQRLTDAASNQVMVSTTNPAAQDDLLDPTLADGAVARAARLPGVTLAVPVRTYGGQSNPVSRTPGSTTPFTGRFVVTEASYLRSIGSTAISGDLDLLTNPWNGPTAVVGSAAATELGVPASLGPGVQLWINGSPVDVVAVLAPTGDTLADDTVYCSRAVVADLTNITDAYLLVRTQQGYAEPLAKALPLALDPANPGSIQVSVVSQLATLQAGINSDMSRLLGVLAWVILALSALTAGTTMFLSVQHRAPQIALRRAMGASRASVFRVFMYEGLLTGLAGGALGALVGSVLVWLIARHDGWPPCLGAPLVLLGLAAGLVVGAIASAIPAVYAARRDPATILRTV